MDSSLNICNVEGQSRNDIWIP